MRFVDSNVWLYAMAKSADPAKKQRASEVVASHAVTVSTQVVNEVCHNLRRKANFTDGDIAKIVASFYENRIVVPVDQDSMLKACQLRTRYSLSFWDSQLISCALLAGCTIFESEDMDDGLLVEGALRISNPFKS